MISDKLLRLSKQARLVLPPHTFPECMVGMWEVSGDLFLELYGPEWFKIFKHIQAIAGVKHGIVTLRITSSMVRQLYELPYALLPLFEYGTHPKPLVPPKS